MMFRPIHLARRTLGLATACALVAIGSAGCKASAPPGGSRLSSEAEQEPAAINTLSQEEEAEGWRLLFDGRTTSGWRKAHGDQFPDKGWEVRGGELIVLESGGGEAAHGGDIVTVDQYRDFDLMVDFLLAPGANSGIKYLVDERLGSPGQGSAIGFEYQLLDDAARADAESTDGKGRLGGLYDLIAPPPDKPFYGAGKWQTARIVLRGSHVEHWLNGTKLFAFDRAGEDFRRRVAASKFEAVPGFGRVNSGHILLQDHGNRVSFRNIKIRGKAVEPQTSVVAGQKVQPGVEQEEEQ